MPSSLSHAMVAVALGSAVAPRPLLRPFLIAGAVCAVVPDLDAIGRTFGNGGDIEALGGHRGFTHSLAGAALAGLLVSFATLPDRAWSGHRLRLTFFIMAATAAQGVLDAFTIIGATTSPVQFLSPFSTRGYVSPWKPITGPFSELFFVLLPLIALTRWIWYVRGIPWPQRRREDPIVLKLDRREE